MGAAIPVEPVALSGPEGINAGRGVEGGELAGFAPGFLGAVTDPGFDGAGSVSAGSDGAGSDGAGSDGAGSDGARFGGAGSGSGSAGTEPVGVGLAGSGSAGVSAGVLGGSAGGGDPGLPEDWGWAAALAESKSSVAMATAARRMCCMNGSLLQELKRGDLALRWLRKQAPCVGSLFCL